MASGDGANDAAARHGERLREAAAHGVRWSALARPLIEVLQLGSMVVLARLIAPAEFGRFAVALIAQEVATLIVAAGLGSALVQRRSLRRGHVQTGMGLALLGGGALALLTVALAGLVVEPVFDAKTALYVELMAPLCLVSALATVPMATLRRRLAFRRLSEIEVATALVRVGACVGLAALGLAGLALVLGVVCGALTLAVLAWLSAPPPAPRLSRRAARDLLSYSLPLSLASVSWVGFRNADYAIVGARLGPLQTGLYFRAYTLAVEYQSKLGIVMTQVGFPVLARTRDERELAHLHRQMVRLLTIALCPLLVLLAISAPVLVPFLFGPGWGGAVTPVQILALAGAATVVTDTVGTVLMATGRTRALLGFGWAHFLAYATAAILVVPLGIVAVAGAAAVVHTLFMAVAYALLPRTAGERPLPRLWADVAPAFVSCLALAAVALPASLALTAAGAPTALWLAALGAVAVPPYLLTLRFRFPAIWAAQRSALRRIVPSRRSRRRPDRDNLGEAPGPA